MKKSLEIQVEEKQVAEIKNKVQTVKNSLEVTNSSIKQTHNIRVTIDTHPAEMNDVSVERTEPKHRDWAQSEIDPKDQEKSETSSRERDEQGEDRNQERFGEVILYSEERPLEGKAQR